MRLEQVGARYKAADSWTIGQYNTTLELRSNKTLHYRISCNGAYTAGKFEVCTVICSLVCESDCEVWAAAWATCERLREQQGDWLAAACRQAWLWNRMNEGCQLNTYSFLSFWVIIIHHPAEYNEFSARSSTNTGTSTTVMKTSGRYSQWDLSVSTTLLNLLCGEWGIKSKTLHYQYHATWPMLVSKKPEFKLQFEARGNIKTMCSKYRLWTKDFIMLQELPKYPDYKISVQ